MSPIERAPWHLTVIAYPCPTCDAAPGEDCVTLSGVRKHEPHADRSRLASEHHWRNPDDTEETEA